MKSEYNICLCRRKAPQGHPSDTSTNEAHLVGLLCIKTSIFPILSFHMYQTTKF